MTSYPTILGNGGQHDGNHDDNYTENQYSVVGLGQSAMVASTILNPSKGFQTEAYAHQKLHVAGSVSDLAWGVEDEAFGATLTFSLNKNSSPALAVQFGSYDTGWMTDSSLVPVSSGDWLDFEANVGSGNSSYHGNFNCASASFTAATGSVQLIAATGPFVLYSLGTLPPPDRYISFLGDLYFSSPFADENLVQFPALTAGTWEYLACHIEANTFSNSTTIHSRLDGGDGNMTIVIPGGSSGIGDFEDVTYCDSVSAGGLLDYVASISSAYANSLTVDWIGCHYFAATASNCMIGGVPYPNTIVGYSTAGSTSLFGGGDFISNGQERANAHATGKFPYDATLKDYSNNILDGEGTCTLLINGNVSSLVVSVSEGMTGWLTDNFDTAAVSAGDTCANQIAGSGVEGTSITWRGAGLLVVAA